MMNIEKYTNFMDFDCYCHNLGEGKKKKKRPWVVSDLEKSPSCYNKTKSQSTNAAPSPVLPRQR